jgi:hypothetical protein
MGFKANHQITGKLPKKVLEKAAPSLSLDEIMSLLYLIKNSQFTGNDLERMYNLTLKLQEMFLFYKKIEEI